MTLKKGIGCANVTFYLTFLKSISFFIFRFFLYYYSNFEFKEGTEKETILTVEIETNKGNVLRPFDDDENEEVPPLELLIRTK